MSFLFILKLLGVLLLCILGLLVLILIIPFRYSIEGDYKEKKPMGKAGVSWLLHFVSFKIQVESFNEINGALRILGIRVKEFKKEKPVKDIETQDVPYINTPYDDSVSIIKQPETESTDAQETLQLSDDTTEPDKEKITDKLKKAYEILNEERAKKSVRQVIRRVFKILKSIFPKRGNGYFTFGTGDPYSTGEILEVLTFFYPLYGKTIEITPDFCNKLLEGELSVRGRVFLCKVLFEAALIYFNKTAKKLYKELKEVFE